MARKTPKDRTIGENALYCKNAQWSLRANIKEKYWIPPTASEEKNAVKIRSLKRNWICTWNLFTAAWAAKTTDSFFRAAPFLSLSSEKPVFLHYLQNWQLSQECKLENRNSQFKWLFIWGISELLSTKRCDFEIVLQRILKTCFSLKTQGPYCKST